MNVTSNDKSGVFIGDAIHHPMQLLFPDLSTRADSDMDAARISRRALIDKHAGTGNLVMPHHFSTPACGTIEPAGQGLPLRLQGRHVSPCAIPRGHHRRQAAPFHRRGISRIACATDARSISTASASKTSPSIRPSATPPRSIAKLYDALHADETRDVLTAPTDTGSGGYTHKFFKAARSREQVIAQRDAIAAWARISYGWMGRSPDYKAALMNTLGANAAFYGDFADNARAWHKRGAGIRALSQPRAGQPADRPQQAGGRGQGRLHHHPEGDRRRHLRLRRQGGGDQFGADALQFPRPEHGPGDHRPEHGGDVHRADGHARHQADLPRVLRDGRRRHRLALRTIRSPRASTRTTPSSCSTTPSSPGRTCSSIATCSG